MVKDKDKLFKQFHKKSYQEKRPEDAFCQKARERVLQQQIEKAVRFIEAPQFHTGFAEIFSPLHPVLLKVSITQDPAHKDLFQVHVSYHTPEEKTLFKQEKTITHHELKKFADEYDKHHDEIERALRERDNLFKK